MKALVLAAGKSTRIEPVAKGLPKPLLEVDGEAILSRNLRWVATEGLNPVWINLHHRPDEIRAFVGDGSRFGLDVRFSEEKEILGTAGAVKQLEREWSEPFVVVYGDNLMHTDLRALVAEHSARSPRPVATMGLFDRNVHAHTGMAGSRVRVDGEGRILEFIEGAGDEVSTLVNAGVYVLEPAVLELIPSGRFYDFGRDVFPRALAEGRDLRGSFITGYCMGIDTPESYFRAQELIATGTVRLP